MAIVYSNTETTYNFKDGKTYVTVHRRTKDLFHPINGGIISKTTTELKVTGNADKKLIDEFRLWLVNGCKPPLPRLLKRYIEENPISIP
jgi:hypothetical protein